MGDELPTHPPSKCTEGDVTAPLERASPPQPVERPLPGATIAGRYRLGSLLGEGGMGQVYRAVDLQLEREVAVKLLRAVTGDSATRLLREAKAQARVNHDHVAKVIEVGAAEGVLFIAMQLVAGPSLKQVARELDLEQKVEIVRQAAEAAHAAHREGLVHRDLKPGNIMLEREGERGWKAYVVDFGLVREMDTGEEHTATVSAGTPHYMAPEQIRGESTLIDWRTDVYALGATLYELLVGAPLFANSSGVAVLLRAMDEPARFPRGEGRPPRDLEAITLRCLEKEPHDRYGSARELAEDLGRFLAGEPVRARPVPSAVRLVRRARRHPGLTAAALLGAAAVTLLAGLWLSSSLRSRQVAELSRRFGEQVAAMESIGRIAALQPLHDVRREQELIRDRMGDISARLQRVGALAQGPGRLALGRGHLALGNAAAARRELQAAWDSSYQTPEVAAALGEALTACYRVALDEARRIPGKAQRAAQVAAVERELRQPTLTALIAGRGAARSNAWLEGQIHLLERSWDKALACARDARTAAPWLHETWRLEGDVLREQGEQAVEAGEWENALGFLEGAGAAYAAGIEVARSDVALREAECRRRVRTVDVHARRGDPLEDTVTWASAACNDAVVAQPRSASAHTDIARLQWRLAEARTVVGADPRPALEAGLASARRAIEVQPDSVAALNTLGLLLKERATYMVNHGGDPRPTVDEGVGVFRRAIELDPSFFWSTNNLGNLYMTLSRWQSNRGEDAREALGLALAAGEQVLAAVPEDPAGHHNIGLTYQVQGEALYGLHLDPRDSWRRAVEHLRKAIAVRPEQYQSHDSLGSALNALAQYAEESGDGDPLPLIEESIAAHGRALELLPDYGFAVFNRSSVRRSRARVMWHRGLNPDPDLAACRADLLRSRELMPDDNSIAQSFCDLALLEAEIARDRGQPVAPIVAEAEREAANALARNPNDAVTYRILAQVRLLRAAEIEARGGDPRSDLERAREAAHRARAINARSCGLRDLEAQVMLAQARTLRDPARRSALAQEAAELVRPEAERCPELAPTLKAAEELAGRS